MFLLNNRLRLAAACLAAMVALLAGPVSFAAESGSAAHSEGKKGTLSDLGLPHYQAPAAYHEDLVIHSKEGTFTMCTFWPMLL